MKWILTSQSAAPVHVFNLVEGDSIKEILRYNPLQQSVRLSSEGKQRLFFIERMGIRSNHFRFKNEYGFEEGGLFIEQTDSESGNIRIEDKNFYYRLQNNNGSELQVFDQNGLSPALSCQLASMNGHYSVHEYAGLLLGLCWYLFTPASFSMA